MKLFVQTTTALVAMATSVSAFAPVLSSSSKATTTLMAAPNIWSTMGSLEGPSVCWGPEGVIIGHEEIEIKEYDNFNMFRSALDQCGLANELRGLGPYTLLLPTDSAVCAYNGMLDEETLRYHIIKGDIYSDELLGSLETLNPNYNLNAKQEFRKAYVDDGKFLFLFFDITSISCYFYCVYLVFLNLLEFEFEYRTDNSIGRFQNRTASALKNKNKLIFPSSSVTLFLSFHFTLFNT
jgi:uncharacterized surface protein with fasciclin (FAS1) repeats